MRMRILSGTIACAIILFTVTAAQGERPAPDLISLMPSEIEFSPGGGALDVSSALISGDPDKEGVYVMRLRVGAGVVFAPHFHDQDRYVTVISGTWAFGTGESGRCEDTRSLQAGSFAIHPKGAVHYDGSCTDQPVEVQIIGVGPVTTSSVDIL